MGRGLHFKPGAVEHVRRLHCSQCGLKCLFLPYQEPVVLHTRVLGMGGRARNPGGRRRISFITRGTEGGGRLGNPVHWNKSKTVLGAEISEYF